MECWSTLRNKTQTERDDPIWIISRGCFEQKCLHCTLSQTVRKNNYLMENKECIFLANLFPTILNTACSSNAIPKIFPCQHIMRNHKLFLNEFVHALMIQLNKLQCLLMQVCIHVYWFNKTTMRKQQLSGETV